MPVLPVMPWLTFQRNSERFREVRAGDEVDAEQQRELGHLGEYPGPNALVAGDPAFDRALLGAGGGQ